MSRQQKQRDGNDLADGCNQPRGQHLGLLDAELAPAEISALTINAAGWLPYLCKAAEIALCNRIGFTLPMFGIALCQECSNELHLLEGNTEVGIEC